jgi:hypothetical protein
MGTSVMDYRHNIPTMCGGQRTNFEAIDGFDSKLRVAPDL